MQIKLYTIKIEPERAFWKNGKITSFCLTNWEVKNEGKRMDESNLYISEVKVDSGRMLKRIQAAPQGRST